MKKKEWRVIFFVYAFLKHGEEETEKNLIALLKTLLGTKVSSKNSYLLLLNKVNEKTPKSVIWHKSYKNDRTTLYEIASNKMGKTVFRKYKSFDTIMLAQKPTEIAKAFSTINNDQKFSATKTILFTWDHGSVFGINRREQVYANNIKRVFEVLHTPDQETKKIPARQIYNRFFDPSLKADSRKINQTNHLYPVRKAFGKPWITFDMLLNEDLSYSIKKGLKSKVELLVFANCYMQNLHTVSALNNNAKIIVGTQGDLEYPCYDYNKIITQLESNKKYSGNKLAIEIIEGSKAMFSDTINNQMSIFAVDSEKIVVLEEEISVLADYLIKKFLVPELNLKEIIMTSLQFCFQFETNRDYSSIDLVNFLYQLKIITRELIQEAKHERMVLNFFSQVDDFIFRLTAFSQTYIIGKHTGNAFIDYEKGIAERQNYIGNILPKALSIYLPKDFEYTENPEIVTIALNSNLLKRTTWDSFIIELYSDP